MFPLEAWNRKEINFLQRSNKKTHTSDFKVGEIHPKNKYVQNSVSLFYHLFAGHLCSFEISFGSLKKVIISVFSIAADACLIYMIVNPWTKLGTFPGLSFKGLASESSINLCALFFRILIHAKGKELLNIVRTIEKLELMKNAYRLNAIRRKIIILIVCHTLYFAVLHALCVLSTSPLERMIICKYYNIPFEDPTSQLAAVVVIYLNAVWFITALPSVFIIYFYFICSLLMESLKRFQERLDQKIIVHPKLLLKYSILTDTVFKIHRTFHILLLFVSCQILFNSFYGIYVSLFGGEGSSAKAPQTSILLMWSIVIFSMMCVSSSDTNYFYEVLKDRLHDLLMKDEAFENLSSSLRLCEDDSMNFRLLDSIIICKSLVIKAFGSMLTYGIMIATLGRTVQSTKN